MSVDDYKNDGAQTSINFNKIPQWNKQFIRLGGGGLGSKIDPAKAKIAHGKSLNNLC